LRGFALSPGDRGGAAIATRIRIGDSLTKTLPAIVLLAVNAFLLAFAISRG
jgi:hypothetical protein